MTITVNERKVMVDTLTDIITFMRNSPDSYDPCDEEYKAYCQGFHEISAYVEKRISDLMEDIETYRKNGLDILFDLLSFAIIEVANNSMNDVVLQEIRRIIAEVAKASSLPENMWAYVTNALYIAREEYDYDDEKDEGRSEETLAIIPEQMEAFHQVQLKLSELFDNNHS